MSNKNSIFSGFESAEPSYQDMKPVTNHPFVLSAWGLGDSFTHPGGASKPPEKLPPWEDPTPEVWLLFKSKENGQTIFYHANGCGYAAYDSLTKAQIESGKFEAACAYMDKQGNPVGARYAVIEKNGKKVRIADPVKTEQCRSIFNGILSAMALPVGSTLESLDTVVQEERIVIANVVLDEFNGDSQARMTKFRNPAKVKAIAGNEDWAAEE